MTHINAYIAAVDEAKLQLKKAEEDVAAAEAALATKRKELGIADTPKPAEQVKQQPETKQAPAKKK